MLVRMIATIFLRTFTPTRARTHTHLSLSLSLYIYIYIYIYIYAHARVIGFVDEWMYLTVTCICHGYWMHD